MTAMASKTLGQDIRRTLILAGPLVIGQLSNFGMNFVDTVMAGRLGAAALGAIAVGSSIWSAGYLFVLGVLMAVSATVSQLDGAGLHRQVGEFTRQALWLGLALAAVLLAVNAVSGWLMQAIGVEPEVATVSRGYLAAISWGAPALSTLLVLRLYSEGTGYTRPTMYIGLLGIVCNIPLNYAFMFGRFGLPEFGAVGAGWATAIVYWLQLLGLLAWTSRRPRYRKFELYARFSRPNWREIGALWRLGLPIGLMVFMEGGLFIASALLIGTLGALPVAAHQVAINYAGLMFMVPVGLAGAITVRVGNAIGRGDQSGARRAGLVGMGLAVGFGLVSAGVMIAFPDWIVAMYTADTEVARLAVALLLFAAVFQLADCLQVSAAGALRGLKDTRKPLLYSLVSYWLVGLPGGAYCTFVLGWGARGMWVGILLGLTLAAILLGARFLRVSAIPHERFGGPNRRE